MLWIGVRLSIYIAKHANIERSQALDEKLSQAVQGCAEATPTPAAITGTLPITGTGAIDPTIHQGNRVDLSL